MSEHMGEAAGHAGAAVHHTGAGVHGALGKQLGPMPVGGWLLAVAGGVVVAYYFRRNAAASSAAVDPNAANLPTDTTGWDTADPGGTAQGVGGSAGGSGGGGNGNAPAGGPKAASEASLARAATTNAEWRHHAVLAMAGTRGFDAAHVDNALADYLAGHKLTEGEVVALAATEALCGPPPHTPTRQAPPGTPTPEVPTPGQHDPTGTGGNGPHHPPHRHHRRDNGTPPTKPTHK